MKLEIIGVLLISFLYVNNSFGQDNNTLTIENYNTLSKVKELKETGDYTSALEL
ncbi:MAG: hypothetical protein H8E84_05675 [Flavobacteriales bacterium]|nr:hypothetical protein [Flavobacteriales bacterium]